MKYSTTFLKLFSRLNGEKRYPLASWNFSTCLKSEFILLAILPSLFNFEQTSVETIRAVHSFAIFVLNRAWCNPILNVTQTTQRNLKRVAKDLAGVLGIREHWQISKGTREHEPLLGNRGTKLFKWEDKSMVNKFIKRGTDNENVC